MLSISNSSSDLAVYVAEGFNNLKIISNIVWNLSIPESLKEHFIPAFWLQNNPCEKKREKSQP